MDVRQQILVEATRLFARRGFDATPLQDIATAVGIRKPSLLYHFPSKQALRLAVLQKMAAHWSEALPRLLHAATSGASQFDAVVEEMVAFFSRDPDRARLVIREILDRPDEIDALLRDQVRSWVTIVCDYIRKGQAQGRVYADVDPEAYVVQVSNLVLSGIATYQSLGPLIVGEHDDGGDGARKLFQRHIRELLRVARRGLFVPEPRSVGAHASEPPASET